MLSALDIKPQIPKISLNELFFPAFNTLVPSLYENVLGYLSKVKVSQSDIDVLVATFHSMLSFAFKTQLFEKVIFQKIIQSRNSGISESSHDFESQNAILP